VTTAKLKLGEGTSLISDGSGGLIVGTIDGTSNILPRTITAGSIRLGNTTLGANAEGELVVGAIDGQGNIVNGTITANKLRLGNTTLSSVNNELVVGAIDGTGNIINGTVSAGKLKLDGVTLEDNGAGALKVKAISAEQITTGSLNTSLLNIDGITLSNVGGSLKVGVVDTGQLANLSVQTGKIAQESVTQEGVAGSGQVLNNSSNWTNIATFGFSNLNDTAKVQGIASFALTTTPSNLPTNFEIQVLVDGAIRLQLIASSASFISDNNRFNVRPFTSTVQSGDRFVTLRMRNMGGNGVAFSNVSATAAMR
jgi:hypothetical protein